MDGSVDEVCVGEGVGGAANDVVGCGCVDGEGYGGRDEAGFENGREKGGRGSGGGLLLWLYRGSIRFVLERRCS